MRRAVGLLACAAVVAWAPLGARASRPHVLAEGHAVLANGASSDFVARASGTGTGAGTETASASGTATASATAPASAPATATATATASAPVPAPAPVFKPVHLYLDTGATPLAAYQLTFQATAGDVRIVGIEGGDPPLFRDAPYYDPAAMRGERVVIGDFSTAAQAQLPSGRFRIATIHVQTSGDEAPRFTASLEAAATAGGGELHAELSISTGDDS